MALEKASGVRDEAALELAECLFHLVVELGPLARLTAPAEGDSLCPPVNERGVVPRTPGGKAVRDGSHCAVAAARRLAEEEGGCNDHQLVAPVALEVGGGVLEVSEHLGVELGPVLAVLGGDLARVNGERVAVEPGQIHHIEMVYCRAPLVFRARAVGRARWHGGLRCITAALAVLRWAVVVGGRWGGIGRRRWRVRRWRRRSDGRMCGRWWRPGRRRWRLALPLCRPRVVARRRAVRRLRCALLLLACVCRRARPLIGLAGPAGLPRHFPRQIVKLRLACRRGWRRRASGQCICDSRG
mmetsp:Transcript_24343/g.57656  ORF Transcript_24343/g.57656 Transcript_24343/m.57656 type:complete len:299 (-) Transcript_24343:63-959(-)